MGMHGFCRWFCCFFLVIFFSTSLSWVVHSDLPTGTLVLDYTPEDAMVFLDGNLLPSVKTGISIRVPAGAHRIRVEKDGVFQEREISIERGKETEILIPLTPRYVRVETEPPGAKNMEIRAASGEQVIREKTTPFEAELPEGRYWIEIPAQEISGQQYERIQREIDISSAPVNIELIPRPTLILHYTPEDAQVQVFLDGENVTQLLRNNRNRISISEGKHTIKVQRVGYGTHEKQISIEKGEIIKDSIHLSVSSPPLPPPTPIRKEHIGPITIVFICLVVVILCLIGVVILSLRKQKLLLRQAGRLPNPTRRIVEGQEVGPYIISELIGNSLTGIVYRAQHSKSGQMVALKMPYQDLLEDDEFVKRFVRQGDVGKVLHHPHIVRVLELGNENGMLHLATELVEGEDLRSIIARAAPLPIHQAADIMIQVCEALDYAHLKQIYHRDIKPEHIILSSGHYVKLIDFGIALAKAWPRITTDGIRWLSAYYAFPEREVVAASDLYSLGVVFYEVVTGRVPFEGNDIRDIMRKHEREQPTPPRAYNPLVPEEIESIILKMLEKDTEKRYQSSVEVINALQAALRKG